MEYLREHIGKEVTLTGIAEGKGKGNYYLMTDFGRVALLSAWPWWIILANRTCVAHVKITATVRWTDYDTPGRIVISSIGVAVQQVFEGYDPERCYGFYLENVKIQSIERIE